MEKERLVAFSDGVIAIIITIMVLELRVPHEASLRALAALTPVLLSYVLSFVSLAICWNNHHHFFHLVQRVNGVMLWANMHLLFWLSLIPFATGWMGENRFAPLPTAAYGVALLMVALASYGLKRATMHMHGGASALDQVLGRDLKGKVSPVLYAAAIPLAFVQPWIAVAIYVLVALAWCIPDRRIERAVRRL